MGNDGEGCAETQLRDFCAEEVRGFKKTGQAIGQIKKMLWASFPVPYAMKDE